MRNDPKVRIMRDFVQSMHKVCSNRIKSILMLSKLNSHTALVSFALFILQLITVMTLRPSFSWQQTMLRIKNPKVSVPFYEDKFGFKLIHTYKFDQWGFSLYFLATVPEGEILPTPGTPESASYLWNMKGTCLELTHNHGSENDEDFKVLYS